MGTKLKAKAKTKMKTKPPPPPPQPTVFGMRDILNARMRLRKADNHRGAKRSNSTKKEKKTRMQMKAVASGAAISSVSTDPADTAISKENTQA